MRIIKNFKANIIRSLLVVSALTFLLVIYLPMESYISNISNFDFTCTNFLPLMLLAFLGSTIIIAGIISLLPKKIFNVISSILLAIVVSCSVQYIFLNSHLSLLGVAKESAFSDRKLVITNLLIWIVVTVGVFVGSLFFEKKVKKITTYCATAILCYHVISLIILMIMAPADVFYIKRDYAVDNSGQFEVSSNNNVIIIVFDAYDNKYAINELLTNKDLKDFTMYTNTLSVFDSTVCSINQFMGGCEFDNEATCEDWLNSGWNSDRTLKFYDSLHEKGYKCNAYNFSVPYEEYVYGKFDNVIKYDEPTYLSAYSFEHKQFYKDFGMLTLYRIAPYILKDKIGSYFDEDSFYGYAIYPCLNRCIYYDSEYLENLELTTTDSNILTYTHLSGMHYPAEEDTEPKVITEIMVKYINELKELGVYDQSTIIFMADHGAQKSYYYCIGSSPLFMIKKPYEEKSHLTMDTSPVSFEDFMGTVATLADLDDPHYYGDSVYDLSSDTQRVRYYYERIYDQSRPRVYTSGHLTYTARCNSYAKYTVFSRPSEIKDADPYEVAEILPMKEFFG